VVESSNIPTMSKGMRIPPLMLAKSLSFNSSKKLSESADKLNSEEHKSQILMEAMTKFPFFLFFTFC
jgi:hypothetical protein